MSKQYDEYLEKHKANVRKAFEWFKENLPELLVGNYDYEHQICFGHDFSKNDYEEYEAYDAYFYGGNRSYAVVQNFKRAFLRHIHTNPHHWQYWVLIHDDPNEDVEPLDIPENYILEMICDWWSFSWSKGDLTEIFKWYDEHNQYMKLSKNTRITVEHILHTMKEKIS